MTKKYLIILSIFIQTEAPINDSAQSFVPVPTSALSGGSVLTAGRFTPVPSSALSGGASLINPAAGGDSTSIEARAAAARTRAADDAASEGCCRCCCSCFECC